MSNIHELVVGEKTLVIEVGKLAQQASGAVTVRYGDTVVLVSACVGSAREGTDFLPLTVDFEERLYAAGKIPGSFFRREGRPSQEATLTSRLTDRALRPLFPKGFRNEVQIVITTLSTDQENEPDLLALIGASAALTISEIPFHGPVGATRVGYVNGQLVVNPTYSQLTNSQLELIVAGTKQAVVMLEAGAKEAPEKIMMEAIRFGQEVNQGLIRLQEELLAEHGRPKMEFKPARPNPETESAVLSRLSSRLGQAVRLGDRQEREAAVDALKKELLEGLGTTYPLADIAAVMEAQLKQEVRKRVLDEGVRFAGRGFDEIRPLSAEVGLLARTHGSGLFTRGQTQVLSITTLGAANEEQKLDTLSQEEGKRFMHHYNFPGFSTGEVKRIGSPARREIGHGALAERALSAVIPDESAFPYTIRIVSEVLSSSGSTSMASVCASSLSLMDAGVPIKAPVAGVAMGLVSGEDGRYALLTDIEGWEDAYGDMDFKVAGTAQGVTALQMDIKLQGVSFEIVQGAIERGREARLRILEKMREVLPASRPEVNKYAPRMYKITIPVEKIGAVIGPGGKTIRSITEETKTTVDVENDGTVIVGATSEEQAQKAIRWIESLTKMAEVGAIYTGKVTRLFNFGAMVEILPGKEGLVPINELADHKVVSVSDEVRVGDEVMVKVMEIDRQGRVNLSRRAAFQGTSRPAGQGGAPPSRPPQPPGRGPAPRPPQYRPASHPPFRSRLMPSTGEDNEH